jgi:small-conductance mechanosensitive channel
MLDTVYAGSTLQSWLSAGITIAVSFITVLLLRKFVQKGLKAFSRRTATDLDDLIVDVVGKTKYSIIFLISLYLGSLQLTLPETGRAIANAVVRVAVLLQLGVWASAAASSLIRRGASDKVKHASRTAIVFVAQLTVWSVIVLLALDNMGVNVTALITGLGIGGVAVALALQNVLGDLFASMSITLDEPFVIGDFIVVDQYMGTVQHVGLKTTRITSISGEQIIIANTDLLKNFIRNFGRMRERRIVFSVSVTYQTPHAQLEHIPVMLKEIVQRAEGARFDRAHFQRFGESGMVFEVVYFVTDPDYNRYMDIQQGINLEICRRFETEKIEFALPTQTVLYRQGGPGPFAGGGTAQPPAAAGGR